MLPDAASDEDLVDAAMVDAHACATDDAACGKFCEKVLAETTADISEAQRRARICMESNYKDCTRAWMVKAGPPPPYWQRVVLASSDLAILNFYPTLGSDCIQRLDLGPPAIITLRIISAISAN